MLSILDLISPKPNEAGRGVCDRSFDSGLEPLNLLRIFWNGRIFERYLMYDEPCMYDEEYDYSIDTIYAMAIIALAASFESSDTISCPGRDRIATHQLTATVNRKGKYADVQLIYLHSNLILSTLSPATPLLFEKPLVLLIPLT